MSLRAFNHTVNIITIKKENNFYGMTCAWCMQVGYQEIICLIGEQSITGKMISKGDIIGVSALSKDQKGLASFFGDNHSDEIDKFKNCDYLIKDEAILIKDSKVQMTCKVIDVMHLKGIEEDSLVYAKVLDYQADPSKVFLNMEDMD